MILFFMKSHFLGKMPKNGNIVDLYLEYIPSKCVQDI